MCQLSTTQRLSHWRIILYNNDIPKENARLPMCRLPVNIAFPFPIYWIRGQHTCRDMHRYLLVQYVMGRIISTNIIFLFQSFYFYRYIYTICFLIEICALSFSEFFENFSNPFSLFCKNHRDIEKIDLKMKE